MKAKNTKSGKAIKAKASSKTAPVPVLELENSENIATVGDFKGHPMLVLEPAPEGKEFGGIQLGMRKVKAILKNLDCARRFVASEGESC